MAETLLIAALVIAAAGLVLALWRLVVGPDPFTRAVALDVLTLITLPLLVGVAVQAGRGVYIDVVLVYAVLAFLGVVALARYIERGL